MAGAAGLEPAMTESKSVVLPITPRPNICGRSRLVCVIEVAQTSLEFLDDLTVGFASAGIHQINTILVSHFTNFFGHHSYLLLLVFVWSGRHDLNVRPLDPKSRALPN